MRTSILSRSVVAVASLALGSAALAAATPANAASPSGVTRDMVVTVANGVRANGENSGDFATSRNINRILSRACGMELDGENHTDGLRVSPIAAGPHVDGVLISASLHEYDDEGNDSRRYCTFTALTTLDPAFTLAGSGSVTVTTEAQPVEDEAVTPVSKTSPFALSGDVYVSAPLFTVDELSVTEASMTATGSSTRPYTVTTTTKVADKKSKSEKKAAKKAYTKRLKAAKASYGKALKKAGNSKAKKSAAKKAYSKKRAAAAKKYKSAIANYKLVTKTVRQAENRPFTVSATVDGSVVQP